MRILHTSDWHFGRSFHGVGMLAAQRRFVDQLLETVRTEGVDVLLLAGDVYDRALPGVDVVALLDETLARLRGAGVEVILTSGNHDSATRLGFGTRLLAHAGVHLRTRLSDIAAPVLLPLPGGARLAVYGLPYLEPRMASGPLGVDEPGHTPVTRAAVDLVRADLRARREESGGALYSVLMAHTFASSGAGSDSERALSLGGLGMVPLDLFDGFDYTALGHLHGRQQLSPTVRYSGSPLAYSFSEASHTKGGWLLDFGPGGLEDVRAVDWEAERPLARLRGRLEDLLADPLLAGAAESYCQVVLTDDERPAQAMERLRTRFRHTLMLGFEPDNAGTAAKQSYSERIGDAADQVELCCGFLEHVRDRSANDGEREAIKLALESVLSAEHSA
ncbi:MAG TPA: exonuclease SbcCD subunit D [Micrococcaceae bacterium]